jgi:hypothetical protein
MVKVLINKPIFNVKFILQLMTLNHNLQSVNWKRASYE